MSAKTNTARIYEDFIDKIMNLEYKPGQVITEQEISDKYGVSRTPCRDIFQRLKNDGLITSIPFKASYISHLDLHIIRQSIFMRLAVESKILREIVKSNDLRTIYEMEYNLKLQELLLKREFTPDEFYNLDCEFHKILFKATDNLFIWEQLEKAQIHYKRFKMLDIVEVKNFSAIHEDHKKLVEALKNKNIEELEMKIENHLYSGIDRLKSMIDGEFRVFFNN